MRDRIEGASRFRGAGLAWLLGACLGVPTGMPADDGGMLASHVAGERTGRITGTVRLGSRISTPPMRFSLYPDANRATAASATEDEARELHNVVVYLEQAPQQAATRPGSPQVEQRRLSFEPHVLPVVRGTTVEFPNNDTIFHNVFSLSKAASFDLGRYPSGTSRSVTFDEPGIVKIFCHIHSDMSAVIVVLDNPFFAQPGADGRFVLDGIPPGDYRVAAWHERARLAVRPVRVEAGRTVNLHFEIPLTEGPSGG